MEPITNPPAARYEILVDGKRQAFCNTWAAASAAAEDLKSQNRNSEVSVKDLQTGEVAPFYSV